MAWTKRSAALAVLALAFLATPAWAGELAAPTGEVILTIDGEIGRTNSPAGADFDMAMLEAMPRTTVQTRTPWTEGVAKFEGVLLSDLLALVEAKGDTIMAVALNDYAVPVPAADADTGAIVAYRMNGEYMPVRMKGPLWIIYPFDARPELKSETVYARSAWQLRRMTLSRQQ
jgi:hypothetical protein